MNEDELEKLDKQSDFKEAVLTRMYRIWFFEPLLTFFFDKLDCDFKYDVDEKSLDIIKDNKSVLNFYLDDEALCITMTIHDDLCENIEFLQYWIPHYVDKKFYCYGRDFKIMSFLPIDKTNSIKYCTIETSNSCEFDRKVKDFTNTHNVKELKIVNYDCNDRNYKAVITYI